MVEPSQPRSDAAKFVRGSILKHVLHMAGLSTIGLVSIFLVDFVDIYFLSLLGEVEMAAAVGYAGSALFVTTSFCIGMSIAVGALTSRAVGAGKEQEASRLYTHSLLIIVSLTILMSLGMLKFIDPVLSLLGARGRALVLAREYLEVLLYSVPVLGVAMASSESSASASASSLSASESASAPSDSISGEWSELRE